MVIYGVLGGNMIRFCLRIYRRLRAGFSASFQIVYGTDVVQLGEDVIEEIARHHEVFGLVRLVADLAWRAPMEYLSEIKQDVILCDANVAQIAWKVDRMDRLIIGPQVTRGR
jgi:hypothetical protein